MLTYNTSTRDLDIKIALTLATGVTKQLTASEIVSYRIQEDCGSAGYVLGSAASAAYDLIIENSTYSAQTLVGATVSAQIGIKSGTSYVYSPFGVWYVDRATVSKRSATVQLFGKDALAGVFNVAWTEPTYPITIGGLAQTACDLANVDLVNSTFLNSTASFAEAPEWPEGMTARDVISMCAACAGGFARMTRDGKLEIATYNTGDNVGNVTEDTLFVVESGNGRAFSFNCLAVRKVGEEDFTRYTVTEAADSAANTLQIDGNPLMTTDAMANAIKTALTGFASEGITARWIGDPSVRLGDKITFDGSAFICNSQSFTFEGGLYAETACELSEDTATSSGYTARDLAITASGMVQGSRIVNESVTTNALAANTVTAGKIAAGAVETDKLAAGSVTAGKLAAEAVTTDKLAAGAVTAGKLAAEAVTTDKLAAGAVTANKIEAGAVETAKLAADAVTAEKIASGTITADRLKAKTITAESGIIDDSAIGTAQIADGSITSAKVVSLNADVINAGTLSAERLLLVGEDGVIYKINAASSGLSLTELQKDQYKNYINGTVIVAKSITAAQIAAQSITGNEILAGSVTAKEIDVSDLFADEATVNALNAMDIRGNPYLQLYVTDKVDSISVGGRNLLTGTNQGADNWSWSTQTGGKTIEEYLDGGVRAVKMTRDAVEQTGWSVIAYAVSEDTYALLEPNTEYTLSFDYKPSVATANGIMFAIKKFSGADAASGDGGYWKEIPANEWTHVSGQFTTVEEIPAYALNSYCVYITRVPSTVNSVHIFKNLKLEKGNKATDWSPAPEDPAGSLSVNSNYSKVDINTERVRIVSKQMEVAVPSDDGEDDVLRVDADGVHAEVVDADMIVSDSVVHAQGDANYTPADAGELAAILTELSGKHLTGSVSINCKNVSSGSFSIDRISGSGCVSLNNGTMNALEITNCGASVVVYLSRIAFSTSETALTISNAHEVYVDSCTFNAGVGVHLGSEWPSHAYMASCAGDCTTMAQVALMSRLCICGASKPTGTLSLNYGGEVYNATPEPTFAAKADPSTPTTQTVTVSLSPTSTFTSGYGSKLYQGRYSSSQGLREGVMLFSLPSDLTSADKIDSATLTIKRIGGVGQGGGVSAHVRCYDVPGTLYASKTVYENQTVSIDVTSAVKAMKTNGYGGLMLYNPDTTTVSGKSYTKSYSRFAGKDESGAPVLKVSYRK